MLFAYRLTKGDRGQKGERNNNHYLWALARMRSLGSHPPYFLRAIERNKIKILLRSWCVCDII